MSDRNAAPRNFDDFTVNLTRSKSGTPVHVLLGGVAGWSHAQEEGVGVGTVEEVTVDADLGASREGSRTGMPNNAYYLSHSTCLLFIVS